MEEISTSEELVGKTTVDDNCAPGSVKERRTILTVKSITNVEEKGAEIELVVDTGATRKILTEEDWKAVKKTLKKTKLKKTNKKFRPYGVKARLPCIGKVNLKLEAKAGAKIRSKLFVVRDAKESLLGLKEAERLGIV